MELESIEAKTIGKDNVLSLIVSLETSWRAARDCQLVSCSDQVEVFTCAISASLLLSFINWGGSALTLAPPSSEAQAFCVGDEMTELLPPVLSDKTGSLDFVTRHSEVTSLKSLLFFF